MTTNSTAATVMRGSCTWGANTFEVKAGVGMQRFYCHCLYCQQFMGKPYTDVSFVRAKNVVIHGEHATFNSPKLLAPRFRPRAWLAVRSRPRISDSNTLAILRKEGHAVNSETRDPARVRRALSTWLVNMPYMAPQ